MNAIELLKKQHEKVKKALTKMGKSGGTAAEVETIANELVAHMVIEEHVFYPRIRELMTDMVKESFEEHAVARFELARLIQAGSEMKNTRATVLKELLEHHIEEEEEEMFPKVQKNVDADELLSLGEKMEAMFERAVEKGYGAFFQPQAPQPMQQKQSRANGTVHSHAR